MSLELPHPEATVKKLATFIATTFANHTKTQAVIAVSGGIDSAVSLMLVAQALGPQKVMALLLPYGEQEMTDAALAVQAAQIPASNVITINIKSSVDATAQLLQIPEIETVRLGNLKARTRMLCVFDTAKKVDALVCGTENKSEHYLGYFTRFGDAASDLEPISTLYKTQVRQLAAFLRVPQSIIEKAPSAGLWAGQTDEQEMGFTYSEADRVLEELIDQHKEPETIAFTDIHHETVAKVIAQVQAMDFKLKVPYSLDSEVR